MGYTTYDKDQRHPGDPQITGGGGHEPDPAAAGVSDDDERQRTSAPSGGTGFDLKTSDLPEPE